MKIIEHTDVGHFDRSEWEDMSLRATVLHHDDNTTDKPNKHAIVLGDDVIVLEADE